MFVFGHVLIGSRLGTLVPGTEDGRLFWWMVLGTVLPDLLDKPLYYGLSTITGRSGAALGLICGTRTIGHTALFGLLLWALLAVLGKRAVGWALLIGMATHWLLDAAGEVIWLLLFRAHVLHQEPALSAVQALVFPLLGPHFGVAPFHSLFQHLLALANLYTISGELIGLGLLIWQWRIWRARLGWHARSAES